MSDAIARSETGLTKSRFQREVERRTAQSANVILLDVSGSMSEAGDQPGERKIDALRGVVSALRTQGVNFKQLVFSTDAYWTDVIPEPSGGTNLVDALTLVKGQRPQHVIIVSDGMPDGGGMGQEACLKIASEMGCKVDAYYVGPKHQGGAIEFMNKLASLTGGASGACSFAELENKIRLALRAGTDDIQEEKRGSIAL